MCCACGGGYATVHEPQPVEVTQPDQNTQVIEDEDVEITLSNLSDLITVLDVVKAQFVTGEPKPVNKMRHLEHFIDWVENFSVPNESRSCEVRGTR